MNNKEKQLAKLSDKIINLIYESKLTPIEVIGLLEGIKHGVMTSRGVK